MPDPIPTVQTIVELNLPVASEVAEMLFVSLAENSSIEIEAEATGRDPYFRGSLFPLSCSFVRDEEDVPIRYVFTVRTTFRSTEPHEIVTIRCRVCGKEEVSIRPTAVKSNPVECGKCGSLTSRPTRKRPDV